MGRKKLSTYPLIEHDSDHDKTKVINLGEFDQNNLTMAKAEGKIGSFDSYSKIVRIYQGTLIDIETGAIYSEPDEALVICSD